ncbi:MAG TPA: Gfo/Idh/MocA family oxidoreductase, partial [Lacipirellulaceae bacterium]|nr:Gfo/Idh/MocA family oxidoreductase [Lacipirellulaceae bacterium]
AAVGAAITLGSAVGKALADETNQGGPPPQPSPQGGGSRTTDSNKRIRVGVIGCGSVSGAYLPNLAKCPFAEVVSTCDIIPERAERRAKEFGVANHYPHIDKMLAGVPFDLLVNLTDMQEHEHLNRQAISAGKHVWSEKPIANSLAAGQEIVREARERGLRIWGAPIVVASPQFAFMARTLAAGKLGRVASAHADYGHTGPTWSSFFYEKGGGSMPDLGVYNLTSLTGLLGPARAVSAMVSIVTPTRKIDGKGEIKVSEEDNAMVLLDHGNGVLSHVQCGFNFFNPHGHEGAKENRQTISIFGSRGNMGLVGYDWEPLGVDLATPEKPAGERHAEDAAGYVWQQGASLVCETLATGKEHLFTPEHALHVVEIMIAARESQHTGRRIELESTFKWPVVA